MNVANFSLLYIISFLSEGLRLHFSCRNLDFVLKLCAEKGMDILLGSRKEGFM